MAEKYGVRGTEMVVEITQRNPSRDQIIEFLDRHRFSRESCTRWLKWHAEGQALCFYTNSYGTDYLDRESELFALDPAKAEKRAAEQKKDELRRQIRIGNATARPEDFPEIPAEDWHRGTITLRRWGHGLLVGEQVCIDPENFGRVYIIDSIAEIIIEDDEDNPRKVTRIEVSEKQIDGDYAILPGLDTTDITGDVIRMKSYAMKKI